MEINPKVYIILVNYNSWKETIDCLESILANNYIKYEVIVVDNNSTNESVQAIENWLKINSIRSTHLNYRAERHQLKFVSVTNKYTYYEDKNINIVLMASEINYGFAGGNNIALEYIYMNDDVEFVWLLNNDTIVDKQSLSNQISYYQKNIAKKIGILGSKVCYYHQPDLIQCIGGSSYNKWTGYSKLIGNCEVDKGQYNVEKVMPDLIIGACMLLSKDFLKKVEYLDESYFLYFEEQDLARIAYENKFSLDYSIDSIIYHKEGRTIGASTVQGKTLFSDFYYSRSKILFTYKYYSKLNGLTIRMSLIPTIINRLLAGKLRHIPILIRLIIMPVKFLKTTTYEGIFGQQRSEA